jgi:hypothetical protein
MKKIFSLMLVAVLLVSAVPFAASADEVTKAFELNLTPGTYNVDEIAADVYGGSSNNYWVHRTAPSAEDYVNGASFEAVEGGTYTLYAVETVADPEPETVTCETCNYVYPAGTQHTCAKETCSKCGTTYVKAQGHTCNIPENPVIRKVTFVADRVDRTKIFWSVDVMDGKTVYNPGIAPDSDWDCLNQVKDYDNYTFMGWSTNPNATTGDYSTSSVVRQTISGGDRTYYAIYKKVSVAPPTSSNGNGITNKDNTNKVYLHIYVNGNASSIALTRDITNTYLLDDDKISNGEIWTYVKDMYYTAKDPNVGLQIDGLYVNTGSNGTFPQNYYTDTKQDTLSGIKALLDNGYVHVNIMLKNAVSYASLESGSKANADSSNPKTGDMIIAPVAVMGMSVSALAVLFYLNKKRQF